MDKFNEFMEDLVGGSLVTASDWLVAFSGSDYFGPAMGLVVVAGVVLLLWVIKLAQDEWSDWRHRHTTP